jgi:hypothetical protein
MLFRGKRNGSPDAPRLSIIFSTSGSVYGLTVLPRAVDAGLRYSINSRTCNSGKRLPFCRLRTLKTSLLPSSLCEFDLGCLPVQKLSDALALSCLKLLVRPFSVRYAPLKASTKNVIRHFDVGCSKPGKASANWSKGRGTSHPAGRSEDHLLAHP